MRRRPAIYLACAVVLVPAAIVLRVAHHPPSGDRMRPVPPSIGIPAEAKYISSLRALCATATQIEEHTQPTGPTMREYASALGVIESESTPIARKIASLPSPTWLQPWRTKLVAATRRYLRDTAAMRAAASAGKAGALHSAAARLEDDGIAAETAGAVLGAIDCLSARGDPRTTAYPSAPTSGGRTRLSWPRYARAIDDICADNSSRYAYGLNLLDQAKDVQASERSTGQWRLYDAAYDRVYQLIRRLGDAPDDSPSYVQWIERVRQRTVLVHEQFLAAWHRDTARLHKLAPEFKRLAAEENYFGAQIGLRVCSSNGPVEPPATFS
ncbi:MAG: hypothetical protein ACJ76Z_09325 [Thermoleophilaceae bacterium]